MPALKTHLFAVIYTPYYRLQCARQKRLQALPEPVKTSSQLELSIEPPDCAEEIRRGGSADAQAAVAESYGAPCSHPGQPAAATKPWRSRERAVIGSTLPMPRQVEEEKPAALLDSEGTRIIEVNSAAMTARVEIGVTTSLALARASELQIFAPAIDLEHQQQSALLQLCYRYSPYIENTAAGVCTLDLRGRKGTNQEWWARELLAQWRSLGFIAQIGIGPNPEIAWQAAKIAHPFLQVTAESSLLQSLPLESLNPSPYLFDILRNWGIRTLGALTRLPREEIGQRLGLEGLSLWDRAAGRSKNVLKQSQPPETFIESVDLEQRLETLEPLLFMLRRFLERLILRITAVYRLIAGIRLTLLLEDGNKIERQLQIPAPTRDIETLFRIVSQYLDTVQACAPVVGFALEAIPRNPGQNQFDLFQSGLKDPNRFFQTLARLAALLGNDRVGIPEKKNTHQPDSVRLRTPTAANDNERRRKTTKDNDRSEDNQLRIGIPLRRFRPPHPVDVQLSKDKPAWICGHSVTGQVRIARGPWRTSGNWWNPDRWDTQEWDVELEDGSLYRLALNTGRWVVVGVYD
jgi:nucleotidyltransferase/DNA polymerase involved in DNA repair